MIENARNIARTAPVSSVEQRAFDDRLAAELSNTYHRLLRAYGQLKTLATSVLLTESMVVDLLRSEDLEEGQLLVTPSSVPLYPTSLKDSEKAERSPEFGVFFAKRIESRRVFTDQAGEMVKPTVRLSRTSENSLYLEAPDSIIENYIENVLVGEIPYIARFVKDNMSTSQVSLDIASSGNPFRINALRYVPMPGAGAVTLDAVNYDGINPIVLNDDVEYMKGTTYDIARTMPGYLHFETADTSLMRLAFSSSKYITKLKAVAVGISRIIGELNIYAQTSYIGFLIEAPEGTTSLKRVTLRSDGYSTSLRNLYVRVYDSLIEFNKVSNNYVVRAGSDQVTDIAVPAGGLYLLLEVSAPDNVSPTVKDILLQFE